MRVRPLDTGFPTLIDESPTTIPEEVSVVARLEKGRIVGDIDLLLVTPDSYHVINFKTNDTSERFVDAEGVEGVISDASVERDVTYADEVTATADGDTLQIGDATVETIYTLEHTTGMTS